MFNWNDLVFFLELARQGRLGPAARRLKVDHTTVSRRVAELERDLSVKLFDRSAEGFVLTEQGHRLLAQAETMEGLARTIESSEGAASQSSGRVRLATMEGIAAFYFSERFARFREIYPDIVVELVTERHLINLTKREADVSISFVPLVGPRLVTRKVGEFRLALFASKQYLENRGAPLTRADLERHDFVDYVEDLVAISRVHWLLDVIEPPSVTFRSTSMAAQQNAVLAGLGIGLLPFFSARAAPQLVPLLAEEVSVSRELYLTVHEDIEFIGRVRALCKFLIEILREDCDLLCGNRNAGAERGAKPRK